MSITDEEYARRVTRYEVAKRALIVFTAFMVTLSLVVLVSLAIQGKHRGKENRNLLNTIQDCTQPAGECYQRGQKRTAEVVTNLNAGAQQAAAAATACALTLQRAGKPVTYRTVYRCIVRTTQPNERKR